MTSRLPGGYHDPIDDSESYPYNNASAPHLPPINSAPTPLNSRKIPRRRHGPLHKPKRQAQIVETTPEDFRHSDGTICDWPQCQNLNHAAYRDRQKKRHPSLYKRIQSSFSKRQPPPLPDMHINPPPPDPMYADGISTGTVSSVLSDDSIPNRYLDHPPLDPDLDPLEVGHIEHEVIEYNEGKSLGKQIGGLIFITIIVAFITLIFYGLNPEMILPPLVLWLVSAASLGFAGYISLKSAEGDDALITFLAYCLVIIGSAYTPTIASVILPIVLFIFVLDPVQVFKNKNSSYLKK